MSKYCTRCGKPLNENETCSCVKEAKVNLFKSRGGVTEAIKEHMGIDTSDSKGGDYYENYKKIVPDCISPDEGEVPIKQYEIATLRNRFLGIPYAKAIGKLQITNKRVIFRASGRSVAGPTTLQHEFAIHELSGLEVRREFIFNLCDFIIGLLVYSLGFSLFLYVISKSGIDSETLIKIISFIFAVIGLIPFFVSKKIWLFKLFSLGVSLSAIMLESVGSDSFFWKLILLVNVVAAGFSLFIQSIRPNLVLIVKNKSSHDTIDIKRRSVLKSFFGGRDSNDDHTGFNEVLPEEDVGTCIKEVCAIISDIQTLGDLAIDKWKK